MNPKSNFSLFIFIMLMPSSFGSSYCQSNFTTVNECSYVDLVACGGGFVAITNDGRINWLAKDGKILRSTVVKNERYSCLLANKDQAIIAGNNGIFTLHWSDTILRKIPLETAGIVSCMALLKGQLIVASNGGIMYVGVPDHAFQEFQLKVKGNIVALSANVSACYGVTDQGEIIHCADGFNWEIFDFKSAYHGYYKACSFTGIYAAVNQIAVVGIDDDGNPVLYFSSKGNVWVKRTLNFEDASGRIVELEDTINDLFYEQTKNQYVLITKEGKVLTVPSCSHCNKLYDITDQKLTSITGTDGLVIIAGEQGFIKIINAEFL